MKIIVIGGGAGGAGAAARCRRLDENAEIVVYERCGYASYSNCGLPYKFCSKQVKEFNDLIMTTPEALLKQYKLKVFVKHEVVGLDSKEKKVIVKNLLTNKTFEDSYDKLIISAGVSVIKPPIKGFNEAKNIFSVKTPDDVEEIERFLKTKKPKNIVVIGGGFVGLETAENLIMSKYKVTVVEKGTKLLGETFDEDICAWLHKAAKENKLQLILGASVKEIKNKTVLLEDNRVLKADMIISSVGVRVENKMYREAGLKIGKTGGIIVNQKQQTNIKDIYAVGDLAETIGYDGKNSRIALAFHASRQAVVAANNIYNYKKNNKSDTYVGNFGAFTISLFDTTAARVGYSEEELKKRKIKYLKTVNARGFKISSLQGTRNIFLKVLYDKNFKILGAQAVGPNSAEKRISYISLAMLGKIPYDKLADFMVAYSPTVDTTYDVTTMGARLAWHQKDGSLNSVFPEELEKLQKEGWELIDVREKCEWAKGTLKGAKKISLSTLRQKLGTLDKNKKYILHCKTGARSYNAGLILKANGFKNVTNLAGGYDYYIVYRDYKSV